MTISAKTPHPRCTILRRDGSACVGTTVYNSGQCLGHWRKAQAAKIAAELESRVGGVDVASLLHAADAGELSGVSTETLAFALYGVSKK